MNFFKKLLNKIKKNDKKEKPETTGEQKPHEQKHAQEGGNNEKK
jgi:hypothetical protein